MKVENAIEPSCIKLNIESKEIIHCFQMPMCKFDWFSHCLPFIDETVIALDGGKYIYVFTREVLRCAVC